MVAVAEQSSDELFDEYKKIDQQALLMTKHPPAPPELTQTTSTVTNQTEALLEVVTVNASLAENNYTMTPNTSLYV